MGKQGPKLSNTNTQPRQALPASVEADEPTTAQTSMDTNMRQTDPRHKGCCPDHSRGIGYFLPCALVRVLRDWPNLPQRCERLSASIAIDRLNRSQNRAEHASEPEKAAVEVQVSMPLRP